MSGRILFATVVILYVFVCCKKKYDLYNPKVRACQCRTCTIGNTTMARSWKENSIILLQIIPYLPRSGNPVKQLFQRWNLGNLDFSGPNKESGVMLQAKGFESQWEFDLFDLWKKITFGNLPFEQFLHAGWAGKRHQKNHETSMCLGWALSVAKHLFWSPVSHLPWHWSPVLQRQTTMCRFFKLDVFGISIARSYATILPVWILKFLARIQKIIHENTIHQLCGGSSSLGQCKLTFLMTMGFVT